MSREVFESMNGLRGVAALAVVGFHWGLRGPLALDHAYLAVDLFFVLSGFVIAHAYAGALDVGLSPARFLALRVARLYPLYALGLLLGLAVTLASLLGHHGQPVYARGALASTPLALLMLPAVPGSAATDHALYPLDVPAWSLFFELLANLGYALTFRFWTRTRLLLALLAFAAVLALERDALDGGWNWPTFHAGLARVLFSYAAGVLLHSLHARGWRLSPGHAAVSVLLLPALLLAPFAVGDLAVVLVGFPLLVALAASGEGTGALQRAFALLGAASYAIYTLHEPMHALASAAGARLGVQPGLAIQVLFVAVLVPACAWLARRFDEPLHRRLMQWVRARP